MVNFNCVSSPKLVLSWKVLLMSAACVLKFQSFWSFSTKQHMGSFYATFCTTDCLTHKCCILTCRNWISVPNIVFNHWKIHRRNDSQDAINSIRRPTNDGERLTEHANDVSLLWHHSSSVRSQTLERAHTKPFLTVLGKFEPKMLSAILWTPERHFLTSQRIL